jgi:hypothetical protein
MGAACYEHPQGRGILRPKPKETVPEKAGPSRKGPYDQQFPGIFPLIEKPG